MKIFDKKKNVKIKNLFCPPFVRMYVSELLQCFFTFYFEISVIIIIKMYVAH